MKLKKKLYWDLIFRYIVFLIVAVVATALFLQGIIFVTLSTFSKHKDSIKNISEYLTKIEYDNRTKELKLFDDIGEKAWVEILKDNRVIFVKGEKLDEIMEYSQEELALIINDINDFMRTDNFSYEYIPFTGLDGEKYTLLLKEPLEKMIFTMGIINPYSIVGTDIEKEINRKAIFLLWIFLLSIIIIIVLFSRITSKKLIKPLKKLNKGVENVINGDYSIRLDYKASYEFEQMRDAFNYMTEKLENAEIENKKISESKKRLLLDISHDLRTPATTIQGYSEALYNDLVENEEDKRKYLSYIYEKSKLVTDLIDTLFKYSKLENSVYDLNREIYDISEFLRNVMISFYGEINEKEFKLDINVPDKKILFNFDKIELERALYNIIGNIIKYNPKHTILSISLLENNDNIHIIIGDNGVGISKNIRKNIFNALVRGDNTRKTDGGMGLGLSITKKIIELHGGNISVESEVGQGSKFFIDFKK